MTMCDLDVWQYVARLGVRPRPSPSDPFFSDGDAVCAMRTCTYLTQGRRTQWHVHRGHIGQRGHIGHRGLVV